MGHSSKLDKDKARKRLRALLAEIAHYDHLYYQESISEISDFEYDCLQAEVKAIYQQFPELAEISGPGNDLKKMDGLAKYPHLSPMVSLANTYSKEELFAFDQNVREKLGVNPVYLLEPKVDGMAINLIYENGHWKQALTRGDGRIGEEVTKAIQTIPTIPLSLGENAPEFIEVRGEVYISKADFSAINSEQERLGLECFSNARNLASGSVKLLDTEEVKYRRLSFVAHGIGASSHVFEMQEACRQWLVDFHFPVFQEINLATTIEKAWDFIEAFHKTSKKLPYETDGVVVKINDREQQSLLGMTAKAPRWAIAYKYEPESAVTKLNAVTFQVGRTGVITPVAELTPVELSGSRVARATLHNFCEIQKQDIRVGDWVVVQKAGEVIPAIVRVDLSRRDGSEKKVVPPTFCPVCGAPLCQIEGEVALRCTSLKCPEQIRQKMVHFVSKEAMDIPGLGPKIINLLLKKGWLKQFADIFHLWKFRNVWIQLEGFGEKAVDPLLLAIEQAKKRPLWRFIYALSIPSIGSESAKNLANHFKTWEAFLAASLDALQAVPLVGEQSAQAIIQFFKNEDNLAVTKALKEAGIVLYTKQDSDQPWLGKIFVVTGTLSQLTRSQTKEKIEALGGRTSDTVSSKIFALIVGENPGEKLKKAQVLSIPIWDEKTFLEALKR